MTERESGWLSRRPGWQNKRKHLNFWPAFVPARPTAVLCSADFQSAPKSRLEACATSPLVAPAPPALSLNSAAPAGAARAVGKQKARGDFRGPLCLVERVKA